MGKFTGKKLLILGTNVASVDMVKYAQSEGADVTVTDFLPIEKSEAKLYADHILTYSTNDVNNLTRYVIDNKVDAIFAGVSEFNILCAKEISDKTGKQFYFKDLQWNAFMNKKNFRSACKKYDISCPHTFFSGNIKDFKRFSPECLEYPVIIKPVDNGANIGISVCFGIDTFFECCDKAFESSKSKNIIIEQYIEGQEVSATYVVQSGICKLVCIGMKYSYEYNGTKALSNAYIYPAPQLDIFKEKLDSNLCRMITGEHLDNCTIFFQGIWANDILYIFEAGLRLEGTASYRLSDYFTGQNYMKFLIDNSLNVQSSFDINLVDPSFKGRKAVVFSMICRGGEISNISDIDFINKYNSIISFEQRHSIGDYIIEDGSLRQIMFRFVIVADNMDNVISLISELQQNISVKDINGNEMLIKSFDPNVLVGR